MRENEVARVPQLGGGVRVILALDPRRVHELREWAKRDGVDALPRTAIYWRDI